MRRDSGVYRAWVVLTFFLLVMAGWAAFVGFLALWNYFFGQAGVVLGIFLLPAIALPVYIVYAVRMDN